MHKTFSTDIVDVGCVLLLSLSWVVPFINQMGNLKEMEVKLQEEESAGSRYLYLQPDHLGRLGFIFFLH